MDEMHCLDGLDELPRWAECIAWMDGVDAAVPGWTGMIASMRCLDTLHGWTGWIALMEWMDRLDTSLVLQARRPPAGRIFV